jgi:hypothetical protein
MAIGWYESLKDIPWSKALGVAPSIAERGKTLWDRVKSREAKAPGALEARVAELNQELAASFELVQAMAEQHSELVRAVDLLLARTRVLLRACMVLGAVLAAVLVLLLTLAAER